MARRHVLARGRVGLEVHDGQAVPPQPDEVGVAGEEAAVLADPPQLVPNPRAIRTCSPGKSSFPVNEQKMTWSISSPRIPACSTALRDASSPRPPALSVAGSMKYRSWMWVTRSTHVLKSPDDAS